MLGSIQKRTTLEIVLFGTVAIAYFLWRSSTGIVWNDTASLTTVMFDNAHFLRSLNLAKLVGTFSTPQVDGYRPLSNFFALISLYCLSVGGIYQTVLLIISSLLQGITAVAFYTLSYKVSKRHLVSLGALLLLIFSASFQTSALVYAISIQSIVPLFFCLGILTYWQILTAEKRVHLYFFLALIYLTGPGFREFIGILPLLILIIELFRARRINTIAVISALGFLHALFPTALVKLFFVHSIPLAPVFKLGFFSHELQSTVIGKLSVLQLVMFLRWEMPMHMLFLLPPTFLLITFLALYLPSPSVIQEKIFIRLRTVYFAIGALLFLFAFITGWQTVAQGAFWFWFLMLIPLYGLRINTLLSLWFLLAFVPFLKVFQEEVHLLYCLLPASLIVMVATFNVWRWIAQHSGKIWQWAAFLFASLAFLLVLDQGLTAYGTYRVTHGINNTTQAVTHWLMRNLPRNSSIITNASHGYDMQLYSNNYFDFRFTVPWNVPVWRLVNTPKNLNALLKMDKQKHPIYILDVHYPFLEKYRWYDNQYITKGPLPYTPVGRIKTLSIVYPYLDPLKLFAKRPYVSFLGAPDLFKDFYHGPSRAHTPFLHEVFATYTLYRVTDKAHQGFSLSGNPTPIGLYKNYRIYQWSSHFIAIPMHQGVLTKDRLKRDDDHYDSWFTASRYAVLKKEIDARRAPSVTYWWPWVKIMRGILKPMGYST